MHLPCKTFVFWLRRACSWQRNVILNIMMQFQHWAKKLSGQVLKGIDNIIGLIHGQYQCRQGSERPSPFTCNNYLSIPREII